MRSITTALLAILATVIQAHSSNGVIAGEEISIQTIGFISFGILIILFQFVPAAILFGGLVAGLIRRDEKNTDKGLASDINAP
jgi:hypothetical protein